MIQSKKNTLRPEKKLNENMLHDEGIIQKSDSHAFKELNQHCMEYILKSARRNVTRQGDENKISDTHAFERLKTTQQHLVIHATNTLHGSCITILLITDMYNYLSLTQHCHVIGIERIMICVTDKKEGKQCKIVIKSDVPESLR